MKRILLPLIFILFSTSLFSQGSKQVGISGSIQGSQFGVYVPIWLGEKFVIAPALDIAFAEKIGTDFGFSIGPRYYFQKAKVSPYAGLRIGALINKPSSDNTTDTETKVDLLGGLAFGGEYFLSDNFSFGVELQGNFTKSDENSYRFGNPDGLNFNTGTVILATLYF
ncbi:hypothetical protein KFE94_07650 [bacterium SCSIO 12643]|nr:hypothetical protein KFE94_07650 [bacterium SCSIO 12643]